jgi:hypothetical protein
MYDTSQISLPHVDELPVLHPGIDQALADLSVGKKGHGPLTKLQFTLYYLVFIIFHHIEIK